MTSDSGGAVEFSDWVAPHLRAMGFLASRLAGESERDDVVQEALARAWRKWHTFDPARGSPRVWLLAIVADRAGRARRRRRFSVPLDERELPSIGPDDGTRLDLERAIAKLPRRMRMTVDCVYFVGLTISETAGVLGVTDGTVKSTLADARARLRSSLEVTG